MAQNEINIPQGVLNGTKYIEQQNNIERQEKAALLPAIESSAKATSRPGTHNLIQNATFVFNSSEQIIELTKVTVLPDEAVVPSVLDTSAVPRVDNSSGIPAPDPRPSRAEPKVPVVISQDQIAETKSNRNLNCHWKSPYLGINPFHLKLKQQRLEHLFP